MIAFPTTFSDRLKVQFPTEYEAILTALNQPSPISIRYNNKKRQNQKAEHPVPWSDTGVYLDERPDFALDPLFHAGGYYPQEASSMILEQVISHISSKIVINRCLDLCASPGGKSTHLLSLMPSKSVLVSNEIISKRYAVLYENLIKWGYPNFITTNSRPDQIRRLGEVFDVVLVDAPCSGEGLFRKQESWREKWTTENCSLCARRQNQILDSAMGLVRPGGFLIYSTCTFNTDENIDQINYILRNEDFEAVEISAINKFGFHEQRSAQAVGYMALPHRVKGEPFFIACVQRKGDRNPIIPRTSQIMFEHRFVREELLGEQNSYYQMEQELYDMNGLQVEMSENLHLSKIRQRIPAVGIYKKLLFLPEHFSATHVGLSLQGAMIDLDKEQALAYLRHEPIHIKISEKGWQIVAYQGVKIGWIKYDGRRIINKYPMNWRLRLTK